MVVRLLVSLCCVGLLAPTATAAAVEKGGQTEDAATIASMYVGILDDGQRRIQVSNTWCEQPFRRRGCDAVPDEVKRAIKRELLRPVSWVDHAHRRDGTFWVLAPLTWGDGTALIRWAFKQTKRYGCSGRGAQNFTWQGDTWISTHGHESVGCPAVPQ